MRVIVVGGGAFARELTCWARDAARAGTGAAPTAYLDDAGDTMTPSYGLEWLGKIEGFALDPNDRLLMAIGEPKLKAEIAEALGVDRFLSIVHPTATVAETAHLNQGVILGPQSYVAADARVGQLATINSLSGVGHDVQVGAYATISSQVDLMGGVVVEERAFVGSGARILPKVSIGAEARIGAGAVVVRKVKPGATFFAAPARAL